MGVEMHSSGLSGLRKVVDLVFAYTNRSTDVVEKYFVRVDVTEEWTFLVTKLSPHYDRREFQEKKENKNDARIYRRGFVPRGR